MLLITVEIIWTDNFFITVVLGQTDRHTHTHFATMFLITVEIPFRNDVAHNGRNEMYVKIVLGTNILFS